MRRYVGAAACVVLLVGVVGAQESSPSTGLGTLPEPGRGTVSLSNGPAKTYRLDHTVVEYRGISEDYAKALARTVEAARAAAVEAFGFDMPETVTVEVGQGSSVRLFNDGQDHFSLTVRSEADLQQPSRSRVFHLYGMCHEVGHLAMYRLIRDHGWLTVAGAEGWAHYLGSHLVDVVYEREGEKLWPDAYDYRADGMARLKAQLAAGRPGEVAQGAALWMELAEVVGDAGVAPIFRAWGQASVDAADPGAALRKALLAANNDPKLADWWNEGEGVLVFKRPKSGFAARTTEKARLMGEPNELANDDGRSAGQRSMAGGGHAVRFEVPGEGWYLTGVRIYGSRYGYPAAPAEDFHVWLCDADFKVIADFPFPYAKFTRGSAGWVRLDTPPTNVPTKFVVCVGFNPTATKGVYVHYDGAGSGGSLVGLPAQEARSFSQGDWMIRVQVDQLRAADPLRPSQ